ncbi:MAG: LacI family transcriptional regulator [Firmicutes bacterium]|nr:LacI family transcriptional regulator [Bacillota bacterium]
MSVAASPVAAQKLPEPPTALFCFGYQTAVLAVRALVQLGLTPGKQVSVVGFDAPNSICVPRITSVIQPAGEMGALAAELLLERIADQRAKPRSARLSAQLVHGDTSGPPIQPRTGSQRLHRSQKSNGLADQPVLLYVVDYVPPAR